MSDSIIQASLFEGGSLVAKQRGGFSACGFKKMDESLSIDVDQMNQQMLFEAVYGIVSKVISEAFNICYRVPNPTDFIHLKNDSDIMSMCEKVKNQKTVDLYILKLLEEDVFQCIPPEDVSFDYLSDRCISEEECEFTDEEEEEEEEQGKLLHEIEVLEVGDGGEDDEFFVDDGDPIFITNMEEPNMTKGARYNSVDEFRLALKQYCVLKECEVKFKKSEPSRVTVVCSDSVCKWRIHASILADGKSFQVKTVCEPHTCCLVNKQGNSMASQ